MSRALQTACTWLISIAVLLCLLWVVGRAVKQESIDRDKAEQDCIASGGNYARSQRNTTSQVYDMCIRGAE